MSKEHRDGIVSRHRSGEGYQNISAALKVPKLGRHVAVHRGSRKRRPPLSEPSAVTGFLNGLPTSNSFTAPEPVVPGPSSHGAWKVPSVSANVVMALPGSKVGSASLWLRWTVGYWTYQKSCPPGCCHQTLERFLVN